MAAVIWVDLQNDFLPGGALAVPEGDAVVPVANRLASAAKWVVATMDWHPANHVSFAANHPQRQIGEVIEVAGLTQVLWPVHCVQDSPGAQLAQGLDQSQLSTIIHKGELESLDSYSGFFDNGRQHATGLAQWLNEREIRDLYLLGLATDYCVKATALDAQALGFNTLVVTDGCRGVDLQPGDTLRAFEEMQAVGITCLTSPEALARLNP